MEKHSDMEREINAVMNTMRLLIVSTSSRHIEGYPHLKVMWICMLCNFMLQARRHGLYPEVFTAKKFKDAVLEKLPTYRDYLRANMKSVPAKLRRKVLCLFDDLELEFTNSIQRL